MTLGRVVGTVVCTVKIPVLEGHRLLIVEPIDPSGERRGSAIVALDTVQAGVGETVLVLDEGNSSRMILGDPSAAVRTVVAGIVDRVQSGGRV